MNKHIAILLLFIIVVFCGCVDISNTKVLSKVLDVPPIPKPVSTGSSGIAISINLDYHGNLSDLGGKLKVKKVFFIKLDSVTDSFKKDNILVSNYYYEPFMVGFQMDPVDTFLLNIEPGFYAVVGAQTAGLYIYFPEEVIKESLVEVKPNQIVYMGEYKLQKISINQTDNSPPDKLQHYYYSNLLLGDHKNITHGKAAEPWGHEPYFHAPKVDKIKKFKGYEISFLESYKGIFKESGWIESIKNRINDLKS